jgi:NET1-associated nuclear protein 1 (U3 small nucleolar RNA-associated protein 17)
MASILKRKRGPVEVVEPSKKSRSTPKMEKISPPGLNSFNLDWNAALPAKRDELAPTNGGNCVSIPNDVVSSNAEGYEELVKELEAAKTERKAEAPQPNVSNWKNTEPIGGRMIDIDPVFTHDEKYWISQRYSQFGLLT